jgi:hypothetical protein
MSRAPGKTNSISRPGLGQWQGISVLPSFAIIKKRFGLLANNASRSGEKSFTFTNYSIDKEVVLHKPRHRPIPTYFSRLPFVENHLPDHVIPEISETEEEKKLSDRELKAACFNFAHQHFQGKTFRNESINQGITVSRDGLGEWKTVTKSRDQALSIKILDSLLENGIFWKEEEPKNGGPDIKKVFYFKQRCKINDTKYQAILTVKVYS